MEFNNVHLLPHNEEAFIKLKKCLEDNQLVATRKIKDGEYTIMRIISVIQV